MLDLDFASRAEAADFLDRLRSNVGSTPSASPALVSRPKTRIVSERHQPGVRDLSEATGSGGPSVGSRGIRPWEALQGKVPWEGLPHPDGPPYA